MTAIPNNRKIDAAGSRQVKGISGTITGTGIVVSDGENKYFRTLEPEIGISIANPNGVAGNPSIGLTPEFLVDKTFISKGVKTLDESGGIVGEVSFDTTENPFSWLASYYGIRNAIHWETYGRVLPGDGGKTLTLAWKIGATEYLTLAVPFDADDEERNYHLEAHLVIRSTTQVILTLKLTLTGPEYKSYISSSNSTVSMNANHTIDITGIFSSGTGNNIWTEMYTAVYTY